MERRVIVIAGATCTGKSDLAFALAKELQTEIISADSRQVYKYFTIGTAKPAAEMLAEIQHHCIDSVEPSRVYTAADFVNEAESVIRKLHEQNKIPIVVGGTGMYLQALQEGLIDVPVNESLREQLQLLMQAKGASALHELLKAKDASAAERIPVKAWKRVMRAIEVFEETGTSIYEVQKSRTKKTIDAHFVSLMLEYPRATMYERIEQRVDLMIRAGLIEETAYLLDSGIPHSVNAFNTVGYKETLAYLNNEITLDKMSELIKRNTRRFAKRQLTWFRSRHAYKKIHMNETNSKQEIINYLSANNIEVVL